MLATIHLLSSLYSYLSIIVVGAMLLVLISIVYASWRNGISPMPSSVHVRNAVAVEVNREAKSGLIVDAGSGFGSLAIHLAMHCPGWKLVGIENSPIPLWISRLSWRVIARVRGYSLHNVTFINDNLFTYSYEEVDIIVCYLYPGAMKQLASKVYDKLSRGTHIISVCFALPGREPERVVTCGDLYRTKVYVYTI